MKKALITATPGGFLSQFELNNVKILQEQGYEVHYAANFDNTIYQWDQDKLSERSVVTHHVGFNNALSDIRSHRQAYQQIQEVITQEDIEVIHCHTPFAGVLTRMAAARSKQKPYIIYTSHGFHFYKGASVKNWLFYPIEKHLSKKTDVLITINEEDYNRAQEFSTAKKNQCVVKRIPGVGLDINRFFPKPELREWMREQCNVPKGAFHLMTIGELSAEKNIAVIITALRQLKDLPIHYSIFGKGPEQLRLSEYIKLCGLEGQVKLCGYTTDPELVLQSADAFVFPSVREGLGMAALEAMACGVPVIAYDNRGTREYMEHEENGLVCTSGEPMEYIRLIKQMYEHYQQHIEELSAPKDGTDSSNSEHTISAYHHMQLSCTETAKKFALEHTEKIMRDIYLTIDEKQKNIKK